MPFAVGLSLSAVACAQRSQYASSWAERKHKAPRSAADRCPAADSSELRPRCRTVQPTTGRNTFAAPCSRPWLQRRGFRRRQNSVGREIQSRMSRTWACVCWPVFYFKCSRDYILAQFTRAPTASGETFPTAVFSVDLTVLRGAHETTQPLPIFCFYFFLHITP